MDPQEITEELGHPGARNLLDSATLLRLAHNGSDGFSFRVRPSALPGDRTAPSLRFTWRPATRHLP